MCSASAGGVVQCPEQPEKPSADAQALLRQNQPQRQRQEQHLTAPLLSFSRVSSTIPLHTNLLSFISRNPVSIPAPIQIVQIDITFGISILELVNLRFLFIDVLISLLDAEQHTE
ncbi:unnamed protein product [Haemonchus placei]|uniref:Uncharacterized protein n=1 Tax=Haemonchus placei TaxID=6290 RepID=A0A0N4X745_HAEPC|nr:unnamed protein product [Haemonchus placei]